MDPPIEIYKKILKISENDPLHDKGEILGSMTTSMSPQIMKIVHHFIEKNLGDTFLFHSLKEINNLLLKKTRKALSLPLSKGLLTSGGTESNILALYAWREALGIKNVIHFEDAHHSIKKACRLLGLECINVSTNKMDEELEIMVNNKKDSVIVATMGVTDNGRIDNINRIIEVIGEKEIPIHVDAAFGGFTFPFTHPETYQFYISLLEKHRLFTFSVDYHKFLGSPAPASMLFFPNMIEKYLYFDAPYLPEKIQPGILGTRPGYSSAAALYLLEYYGEKGLKERALKAYSLTKYTFRVVKESKLADKLVEPLVPILCLGYHSEEFAYEVWKSLWEKRFFTYPCRQGRGVRIVFMPHLEKNHIDSFIDTLARVLDSIR